MGDRAQDCDPYVEEAGPNGHVYTTHNAGKEDDFDITLALTIKDEYHLGNVEG